MIRLAFFVAAATVLVLPLYGDELETRARNIESKLVAPCCWHSPVSEHFSEESEKIKDGIRVMLSKGKTEDQILSIYVEQFGERILLSPKNEGFNTAMWMVPIAFLLIAVFGLLLFIRSWGRDSPPIIGISDHRTDSGQDAAYRRRIEQELYE